VIRGAPGIGKAMLLEYLASHSKDLWVRGEGSLAVHVPF